MCFGGGTSYHERTMCVTGDRYSGDTALPPRHVGCRRYGPTRTYYPSHYYRRPPCGPFQIYSHYSRRYPPRGVVPGGIGYTYGGHGGRYLGGGRAVMPSPSAMVSPSPAPLFPASIPSNHIPICLFLHTVICCYWAATTARACDSDSSTTSRVSAWLLFPSPLLHLTFPTHIA